MADLNYVIGFDSELSGIENANRAIKGLQNALGVLGISAGLSEIIQLADNFNNLEAKVQLATQSGQNWQTAFDGIKQVANATSSSIASTTELYTKMASVGNEMGLSQQQMLDLTRTINQAIQIGGSSAEQAQAGIMQMAQALQGGTVRAEEYNSMLENTPKVLQTVAQGMGMSMGQLREHMLDGKLSAEQFLGALQNQSVNIQNQFNQIPLTVGNAMTQLKNSVLSMIGDIDNELNQSGGLANFIQSIAKGLDDINPETTQALQANLASIADILKTFGGILSDIYQSANNVMSSLAGVDDINENVGILTRTLQGVSIVLGGIADMFKGLQATANLFIGGITGQLATLYEKLGNFALLPDKLQNYFKSLGEGLRKTSDESFKRFDDNVANFESSTKKALDSTIVTAENMAKQAQKAGQEAVASFDNLASSANASSEQIATGFSDALAKVATPEQFDALTTKLNELATQGKITGEQLANSLDLASQKGAELEQKFGKNIKTLEQLGIEGQKTADVTKQLADTAKILGLDFELASTKATKATSDIGVSVLQLAGKYDELKTQGYNASTLIMQGLDKMLASVKNQADIDMVRQLFIQFGTDGKLSTEQVAQGMDNINDKVSKTPALMDETAKAFKALGIISKEHAKLQAEEQIRQFELVKNSGQASAEQLKQALDKVQRSIATSGDTAQSSWLNGQKSALGLSTALENTTQSANTLTKAVANIGNGVAVGVNHGINELNRLADKMHSIDEYNNSVKARISDKTIQSTTNQVGSRTGASQFLKQSGLDDKQALAIAGGLDNKNGIIDWGKILGEHYKQTGQLTTATDYLRQKAESLRFGQSHTVNLSPQDIAQSVGDLVNQAEQRAKKEAKQEFANQLRDEFKRLAR